MSDGDVLAAELRVATATFRVHAVDCRQCSRAARDAADFNLTGTTGMCPTGQRLHGAVQGHRARIVTAANGGRPTLRLVRGAA